MPINVAIDGPAGAGKSTVSKAVAAKLGFIYADTGALYRAVAYAVNSKGIKACDKEKVINELESITPELRFTGGLQHVFVNGEDVSDKIRTSEISMEASAVSAIPEVREFLFGLQKKIARENNIIMDGRDIGTVVLPGADVKIFLTAAAEERAERRYKELSGKPGCPSFEDILSDIKTRDYNDMNRSIAPLRQAEDAVLADTTEMDFQTVVSMVLSIIKEKTGAESIG